MNLLKRIQLRVNYRLNNNIVQDSPTNIVDIEFSQAVRHLESLLEGDLRDNFEQYRKGLSEL